MIEVPDTMSDTISSARAAIARNVANLKRLAAADKFDSDSARQAIVRLAVQYAELASLERAS